jgi:hypothetical protein
MGSLSALLSSVAQFSGGMNQGLNVLAKRQRDISDTRLFTEQVSLQKRINDQFQNFAERADYDNFAWDIETLMNKGLHEALSDTRNNYEAQQIQQLYQSNYVNSIQKAKEMAWRKGTDALNTDMTRNIQQTHENLLSGDSPPSKEDITIQYGYVTDALNKAVANGRLTHAQEYEYLSQYIPKLALGIGVKTYEKFEANPYEFFKTDGMSEDDIQYYNNLFQRGEPQEIIKAFTEYALNDVMETLDFLENGAPTGEEQNLEGESQNAKTVGGVDRDKIKSELTEYFETSFNKKIKERYEATSIEQSKLITEYLGKLDAKDFQVWITESDKQMKRITAMTSMDIGQDGRYMWYNRWRSIYEEAVRLRDKGDDNPKSGDGNPKAAAADGILNFEPEKFVEFYLQNQEAYKNVYDAAEDFFGRVWENRVEVYINDNRKRLGKTENGIVVTAQMLAEEGGKHYSEITYWTTKSEKLSAWLKAYENAAPENVKGMIKDIRRVVGDWSKLEDKVPFKKDGFLGLSSNEKKKFKEYYENNQESIEGLVYERVLDLIFTNKNYEENPQALQKKIYEDFLPSLYIKELEILREYNAGINSEEALVQFLQAAKNPDAIWTDTRGHIHFAGNTASREAFTNLQKERVVRYIKAGDTFRQDVKAEDLSFEYDLDEKENGHDILLTGTITDMKTSEKYRVELVELPRKNGNDGFSVIVKAVNK